jgi:hypothetical protein
MGYPPGVNDWRNQYGCGGRFGTFSAVIMYPSEGRQSMSDPRSRRSEEGAATADYGRLERRRLPGRHGPSSLSKWAAHVLWRAGICELNPDFSRERMSRAAFARG